MSKLRDQLIRTLWRGHDPFVSAGGYDGPIDLQGWASQHPYLSDAVESVRPSIIVEIGVWKGGSTLHMASCLRKLSLEGVVIAVDTWLGAWDHWVNDQWFPDLGKAPAEPSLFEKFVNNVKKIGLEDYIVPLPLDSINAAEVLRHFTIIPDVVHIDAGHDYDAVIGDIKQWWPALRPGGLLIGDDYRDGNDWPGVKRAFDTFFGPLGLTPIENTNDKCRIMKPNKTTGIPNIDRRSFAEIATKVNKWREDCRIEFADLSQNPSISFSELTRRYIEFDGPIWQGTRDSIQDRIVAALNEVAITCARTDVFDADGAIRSIQLPARLLPFLGRYYKPASTDECEEFELLAGSVNPYSSLALPEPINKSMARSERPRLLAYRLNASNLLVSPLGYQLLDRHRSEYWPAASTRAYPKNVGVAVNQDMPKIAVIIQDIFEGTNYSHFLLDWMPRLFHFISSRIEDTSNCIFLLGGAPSEFHRLVLEQVCGLLDLDSEQFIFPTQVEMWRLEKPVYFFSDLKQDIMHPAHMAHPRSIQFVKQVASRIPAEPRSTKRIYISRSDTPLRQITNESEIWAALRSLGFVMLRLAELKIIDQIELIRGAEVIVAPHGMGLTHIAFCDNNPLIVELHHPIVGTDAYAYLSHALGFRYTYVLGKSTGNPQHHYEISLNDLLNALEDGGVRSRDNPGDSADPLKMEPALRWYSGMQQVTPYVVSSIPRKHPDLPVLIHVRDGVTVENDTNSGWIEASNLHKDLVYSGFCDVWIPSDFQGTSVTLHADELGNSSVASANLQNCDVWQTLTVSGSARAEVANFVLRVNANAGAVVYTTGWSSNLGIVS